MYLDEQHQGAELPLVLKGQRSFQNPETLPRGLWLTHDYTGMSSGENIPRLHSYRVF